MQKQKTIAKWLTVILLVTIAIGSYVLFGTLYNKNAFAPDGSAQAGDGNGSDNKPEPPPHIPFYTSLPREPENFAGINAAHTGGEKDDVVQTAAAVGAKTYLFVSSESEEFDLKKSGLYIAVFDSDTLVYLNVFAPSGEKAIDVKPTVTGVALLTESGGQRFLYLFGYDGRLTAKLELPEFEAAKLYLWKNVLRIIYLSEGNLHIASLTGATIEISPYLYSCGATEIEDCVQRRDKLICVVSDSDDTLSILSFEQYKGFKIEKSFVNLEFGQICTISVNGETTAVLLGESDNHPVLISMDPDFGVEKQASLKGSGKPVMFVKDSELLLVTESETVTFCRHLDVISRQAHKVGLGNAVAVYPFPENKIFQTEKGGEYFLYLLNNGQPEKLFSCLCEAPIKLLYTLSGIRAVLSTRENTGYYHMNFGGADAFSIEIKLPEST